MSFQIIESRPVEPHHQARCPSCQIQIEFKLPSPAPPASTQIQIRCFNCHNILGHIVGPSAGLKSPIPKRNGRKIGTQERPLETAYYDILQVPVDASTADIKKAYRRLALLHHPDKQKQQNDPQADEKFKEIAIAYQVLSDPELRKKYNEFGPKEGAPDGGYVDPEEVFSAIFGGERFESIIGHISLGKDMKEALQKAEEMEEEEDTTPKIMDAKGREILTPEQKAKKEEKKAKKDAIDRRIAQEKAKEREERVQKLVENLERKLSIYVESAVGANDEEVTRSWKEICRLEAEDLKSESYGVELLHAVGFAYTGKSRHFLASTTTFLGVGGWLHNVQSKYHVFSETVSTVRSAIELKQVFDQISAAETSGASPEEKKKLEEQAAEKGLQALFKGAKLEIDSVIRETCDRILSAPGLSREKLESRAVALGMLGEAFTNVRKDSETESEYVKVDTKASRERDAASSRQV